MYCKNTSVHLSICPTVTLTLYLDKLLPYIAFDTITQLFTHLEGKDVNAKVGILLQRVEKRLMFKMTE